MTARSRSAAPWHDGPETAVIAGEGRWDYVTLAKRAAQRADWLTDQGLRAGEAVLVEDRPGPDLLIMQHALWRLNAILVPIEPTRSTARRQDLIATAGVEWQWHAEGAAPGQLIATGMDARPASSAGPAPIPLAAIIATSGSSGTPRAVLLSREAMLAACRLANHRLGLAVGDRWLCCLPRHHVGGLAIGYRCALAGAAVVVEPKFDAERVWVALARERVTHLSLVPPMLAQLVAHGAPPPATLRVALIGGQALHRNLAEQALALGWPLCITYGMTETCSQVATSRVLHRAPEPGVIGPPLPGIEIACPPAGAPPGPIRIRGPVVMTGYAGPDRRSGRGLDPAGWLTTADLGGWTTAGELQVAGRADDALVIGGHNVFPLQVEAQLLKAPGVSAAVVVGLDEPVWGHSLAVAYTGSCPPPRLARWCRAHLASPERPRRLERLAELPLLPSGKYDRARIQRALLGP